MSTILFNQPTHIELQGPRALRYIRKAADHAEFNVIGFEYPKVSIKDYRNESLDKLDEILDSEEYSQFAPVFNMPAQATITEFPSGQIDIDLHPTKAQDPKFMLWIAVGIDNLIPVYKEKMLLIHPLDREKNALIYLYQRPHHDSSPRVGSASLSFL
jgi:hypothetical protein